MTPYVLVLLAATGVVAERTSWSTTCVKFSGDIEIQDADGKPVTVPGYASSCAWCDGSDVQPLILRWNDKSLTFTVIEDSSKTFYLDDIFYFDGSNSWRTFIPGIRGNPGGIVSCSEATATMAPDTSYGYATCPGEDPAPTPSAPTPRDGQERIITLSGLSLQYANKSGNFIEDESGCRVEGDLSLVLGVSGAISACALLAAAVAAAPRLLC